SRAIIFGSDAGWSSLAARRAHNPKVEGSNPSPATKFIKRLQFSRNGHSAISLQFPSRWLASTRQETADMATMRKRRNGDGSTSWDATVRIVGYPTIARSFRTKNRAELWAARTEAA